jgi:hypothetical protein
MVVADDGYSSAALQGELASVRDAPQGVRNDTLVRAAFNLGTLVGAGSLTRTVVEEQLLAAALDVGLNEREAAATIVSGLVAGEQNPRKRR